MLCSNIIRLLRSTTCFLTIHLPPSTPSIRPSPGQKLFSWQEDTFFIPAGSVSSLLYLRDTLSSRKFLVDSEASVSVIPAPAASSNSGIRLVTADGSAMNCSGSRIISLQFGSKGYHWAFKLAQVSVPILETDFLCHNHLLVEVAGDRLLKTTRTTPII